MHQTGQLRDLLYTRLQLEGVISQRDVARKSGEVREVVERELRRVSELESIKALPLPGRFDPGLRPGSAPTRLATPDLKHALSTAGTISTLFLPLAVAAPPHASVTDTSLAAVESVRGSLANRRPASRPKAERIATPPSSPSPPGGRPARNSPTGEPLRRQTHRSPSAPSEPWMLSAAAAKKKPRLPHVSVLGRMMPIDIVLKEKIQAKFHGGKHPSSELLMELKNLDVEGRGTITIEEFSGLMEQFNLKLKISTLEQLLISLGLDEKTVKEDGQVPYHAFVQATMPLDYPKPGRYVVSIPDRARGPGERNPDLALVDKLLAAQRAAAIGECVDGTTADSFEDALRAKLQAKVVSGPTELISQFRLFDKEKKGWISVEEFVQGCAMFNLYPRASVLAEIVTRYFDEHGRISFAVFVTSILEAFDYASARQGDAACEALVSPDGGKLEGEALSATLDSTGLPGMSLPWSKSAAANQPFDSSLQGPSTDQAARAMIKDGEEQAEDPPTLSEWGSFDTLEPVATGGIEVDPVQVMADKLAQKTSGPLQHSNLPKLISKFSHDPTGQELTKDEFTAFMQEGLNTNLGKDEIESLVSQMGTDGKVQRKRLVAAALSSDYPQDAGKHTGVLTLTHPADAIPGAGHRVPTQPRAPAGFTKGEAIDPVAAVLDKVAQRAKGAKSAEGAEAQVLRRAFKHFDLTNDGTVDAQGVERLMHSLNLPHRPEDSQRFLSALGQSGEGPARYRDLTDKIMAPKFREANKFRWLEGMSEIEPLPHGQVAQWPTNSHAKSEISGIRSDKRQYGKRIQIWGNSP